MDDFDFDFQEDTGNNYESNLPGPGGRQRIGDEAERFRQNLENAGVSVCAEKFENPLAIEIFTNPPPPLSFLYDYTNHEDSYRDPLTFKFAKWYSDPKNALISKIFVACAIDDDKNTRWNENSTLHLNKFFPGFNRTGLHIADTLEKNHLLPESTGIPPRLARIYNVWYRNTYTADGARFFYTQKLGKPHKCMVCGSTVEAGVVTNYGDKWLHLCGQTA